MDPFFLRRPPQRAEGAAKENDADCGGRGLSEICFLPTGIPDTPAEKNKPFLANEGSEKAHLRGILTNKMVHDNVVFAGMVCVLCV